MNRKNRFDALKVALVVLVSSLLPQYLRDGEKLSFALVAGTVVAATVLGLAHFLFTTSVAKAQAQGPDQSPLKWYFSPVLFIGVGLTAAVLLIAGT